MDNSKEMYYLIGFQRDETSYNFQIIKKTDESKTLKIKVKNDGETTCNCMDWRIRCKGKAIACKHIYYLLQTMINYELFDYFDNQVMKMDIFDQKIKERFRTNIDFEVKNIQEDN